MKWTETTQPFFEAPFFECYATPFFEADKRQSLHRNRQKAGVNEARLVQRKILMAKTRLVLAVGKIISR